MAGIIGRKIGMSSFYDEKGKNIPCTLVEAGPCIVTQIKDVDIDGYSSEILGTHSINFLLMNCKY